MVKVWRTRVALDLVPAVLAALFALWLWAPSEEQVNAFASTASATFAILASVVTFACTGVYASTAQAIMRVRQEHGAKVRRIWAKSLGIVICASVAALVSLVFAGIPSAGRWIGSALVLVSVLALFSTLRSVSWMALVWKAEDEPQPYRIPEHLRAPEHAGRH